MNTMTKSDRLNRRREIALGVSALMPGIIVGSDTATDIIGMRIGDECRFVTISDADYRTDVEVLARRLAAIFTTSLKMSPAGLAES